MHSDESEGWESALKGDLQHVLTMTEIKFVSIRVPVNLWVYKKLLNAKCSLRCESIGVPIRLFMCLRLYLSGVD
jgi:hypothetical protein